MSPYFYTLFVNRQAASRRKPRRSGVVTLDYVIVTAIAVPLTGVLVYMLVRSLAVIFQFASATTGWPFP